MCDGKWGVGLLTDPTYRSSLDTYLRVNEWRVHHAEAMAFSPAIRNKYVVCRKIDKTRDHCARQNKPNSGKKHVDPIKIHTCAGMWQGSRRGTTWGKGRGTRESDRKSDDRLVCFLWELDLTIHNENRVELFGESQGPVSGEEGSGEGNGGHM